MTISTKHKYNRGKISKVIEKVYVVYNGEWLCIVVEQKNQNRKKERKALLKESAKNRLVLLVYCVLSGFIHLTFHCPEQYARARMCVCMFFYSIGNTLLYHHSISNPDEFTVPQIDFL